MINKYPLPKNYALYKRDISDVPGAFFVVWSDADRDIFGDPTLHSRLIDARTRVVQAWADFTRSPLRDSPDAESPALATFNKSIHDAHIALRDLYRDAGIGENEAQARMERDKLLFVNAVNNAIVGERRVAAPSWASRIAHSISKVFR